MSYILNWKTPALGASEGKSPINVAVGQVVTSGTGLRLTGKGTANYGQIQQENLMRMLENFASPTASRPAAPTVGQLHFNSDDRKLYMCQAVSPATVWVPLSSVTEDSTPPVSPAIGDIWLGPTDPAAPSSSTSSTMYVYTGIGRYPQPDDQTIGGWDQLFPQVEMWAGREEYDYVAQLVEQLVGEAVSSYGNGARGRLFDFTNLGELDHALRLKFADIGADANVLISGSGDQEITRQALSRQAVASADRTGMTNTAAHETFISVNATTDTTGAIYYDGAVPPTSAGNFGPNTVNTYFQHDDAFIMYHRGTQAEIIANLGDEASPGGLTRRAHVVRRISSGQWEYDVDTGTHTNPTVGDPDYVPGSEDYFTTGWKAFIPTSDMYIVGTLSTYRIDAGSTATYPATKSVFLWHTAVPLVGTKNSHLKVEPNSQDWDKLLAGAKWALNRLDIPQSVVNAISPMPFVTDGRPAPIELTSLIETDIRYPSAARRSSRKGSAVTAVQRFTETVNAINVGIANRFSMRGVSGLSGIYTSYPSNVLTPSFKAYTFSKTGNHGTLGNITYKNTMKFRFTNHDERTRFIASGGVLELRMAHSGGGLAGDSALNSYITGHGLVRITGDSVRIFQSPTVLTLSETPTAKGSLFASTTEEVLYSDAVMQITALKTTSPTEASISILVQLIAGGPVANDTIFNWFYSKDQTVSTLVSGAVFPSPLAYVSNDGSVYVSEVGYGTATVLIP